MIEMVDVHGSSRILLRKTVHCRGCSSALDVNLMFPFGAELYLGQCICIMDMVVVIITTYIVLLYYSVVISTYSSEH